MNSSNDDGGSGSVAAVTPILSGMLKGWHKGGIAAGMLIWVNV